MHRLIGARTYRIHHPSLGAGLFVRGERVPYSWFQFVPPTDRALFESDAPAPRAEDDVMVVGGGRTIVNGDVVGTVEETDGPPGEGVHVGEALPPAGDETELEPAPEPPKKRRRKSAD